MVVVVYREISAAVGMKMMYLYAMYNLERRTEKALKPSESLCMRRMMQGQIHHFRQMLISVRLVHLR